MFAAYNPGSVMSKLTAAAGISHTEFWGAMVKKALGRIPKGQMKLWALIQINFKSIQYSIDFIVYTLYYLIKTIYEKPP